MRSVHLLVLVATVVGGVYLVSCSGNRKPEAQPNAASSDPASELVIGEPVIYENLAIFPVSTKTPRISDRFITLDEGLRAGTVEILERGALAPGNLASSGDPFATSSTPPANGAPDPFATPPVSPQPSSQPPVDQPPATDPIAAPEQSDDTSAATTEDSSGTVQAQQNPNQEFSIGNSVNQLMVVNRSDKPLYLMPGEIIIGGSQDRAIAEELVIAPGSEPTAISVFCVEQGRWGRRERAESARLVASAFPSADLTASESNLDSSLAGYSANLSLVVDSAQLADDAYSSRFLGSIGSLNKDARMAVQGGEGQGKVWEEVADQNSKFEVRALTGTFAANYAETEALQRLEPFLKQLHTPVSDTPNVVGVIVAVNGKIESMDVFESTPLFQKLWPKLLKSYALDASTAKSENGDAKIATLDDASRFLQEIASTKTKKKVVAKADLSLSQSESDDVLLFTAHERKAPADSAESASGLGGMGGGGFGGAVHGAGFSK